MSIPQKVTVSDCYGKSYDVVTADLVWRPSAYAIVIDDGKILLSKQFGKYILPGGCVELGETPEEATIREAKEETGFIISDPKIVDVQNSFFTWRSEEAVYNYQAILLFYTCDLVGGEASIDEMEEAQLGFGEMPAWIPLDQLNEIECGGTFDWRKVVKKSLATQ